MSGYHKEKAMSTNYDEELNIYSKEAFKWLIQRFNFKSACNVIWTVAKGRIKRKMRDLFTVVYTSYF